MKTEGMKLFWIQARPTMCLHWLHPSCAGRLRCSVTLCAVAIFTALLTAQQPPQFRSRVDLVHLDVSVLDKNRRPVKGLTAADFTVLEDGKPQVIAAFDAIDLPDPAPPSTPWMRTVSPDVRRNTEIAERRLVAIVMDDMNIPFDVAMLRSSREIGRLVVDKLGPNDLASVIFTRDNRNAQEFTSDRTRLLKAVESFEFGHRTIGYSNGEGLGAVLAQMQGFESSVGVLTRIAQSLAEVPQRRKTVIYIGVGLPAGNAPAEIGLAGGPNRGAQEVGAIMTQMRHRLMETYRQARLSNVNVYTVSPAGVGGMAAFIEAERLKGRSVPSFETSGNYLDFLMGLADNTGGRAFPERNEFESALTQVFLENGSYYLLGYSPPNPADDGKHRRVDVKVNREGTTVRTRNGYYNDKPSQVKAVAEASPLTTALSGLLPKTDIEMLATAAPFLIPGRPDSGVVVVVGVRQDAPARSGRTKEAVDFQIAAFSQEGAARGSSRYETEVTLRPGPAGPIEYEVLSSLVLRPGRYQLRLSAHVGAQARSGSVYYDLDVPDFEKLPISISGLVLTSEPRPVASDSDRIRQYVPIAPTAKRAFLASDRVSVFGRIYQGQSAGTVRPVQVTVTVTDARGDVRTRLTQTVAVDQFSQRETELRVGVPIEKLPAGEYLLTLGATGARGEAQRHLRFEVR